MPDVLAALEHCKWLISKGRGSEPCKVLLPRIEAQRRRVNKEKHKRLIKELSSPEEYSDWQAEFDRYYQAAGNPVIARSIMVRLLQQLSTESIRKLAEDQQIDTAAEHPDLSQA